MSKDYPIAGWIGRDLRRSFQRKTSAGVVIPVTGTTALMHVKQKITDDEPLLVCSTADARLVTNEATDKYDLVIPASVMFALAAEGRQFNGYYDIALLGPNDAIGVLVPYSPFVALSTVTVT